MKRKVMYLYIAIIVSVAFLTLVSCDTKEMIEYYAEKSNYVSITGTVSYVKLSEDSSALYLAFDDMSRQLSDNCFKVIGDNLIILQDSLGDETIQPGDQLEFITAPRYFGDGYVMPIVSIQKDGTELLSFEDGVNNLLAWLDGE